MDDLRQEARWDAEISAYMAQVQLPPEAQAPVISDYADTRRNVRRHFSWLGASVLTLWCAGNIVGGVLLALLMILLDTVSLNLTLLCSTLTLWIVGLPLAYLILKKLPRTRQGACGGQTLRRVKGGEILLYLLMGMALMLSGNLLGQGIEWLFSLIPGVGGGNIADVLDNYALTVSPWVLFFSIVLVAPIMEEFFFRKLLLDRTAQYGHVPAMLFSGILFGALHGNIAQFLYASLFGILLAHIYMTHGKLWICILLHALLNGFSFISMLAMQKMTEEGYLAFLTVQGWVMLLAAIAGAVLLILRVKNLKKLQKASLPQFSKLSFGNWSVILFLILSAASAAYMLVLG